MANSDLLGVKVDLPDEVIKTLSNAMSKFSDDTDSSGYKRAKFLLKNKKVTYEQLKRIKNYFDNLTEDEMIQPEFFLNGGNVMRKWVEFKLNQLRSDSKLRKKALTHSGMDGQYKDMDKTLSGLKINKQRKDNITRTDTVKSADINSIMNEQINRIKAIYKHKI